MKEYEEDEYLLLSGIQHFEYCRRQWALIHIEMQWKENSHTAQGRVMHEKVHDPELKEMRNGILTVRGLPVKSKKYRIQGSCDAVEFIKSEDGIELNGREGKWSVLPVEYKKGSPKSGDCDNLQLVAQVLCLEEMMSCAIDTACLYYGETHHRQTVKITPELREKTVRILQEMNEYYLRKHTPKVKKSKQCRNCSLYDCCLPDLAARISVAKYIEDHIQKGTGVEIE